LSFSQPVAEQDEDHGYNIPGRLGSEGKLFFLLYFKKLVPDLQVGLVAILASMLGWLIFIVCFGSFNNGDNL
jgi:hypothetical protein